MTNGMTPGNMKTRPCGALHPEGVPCLILVFHEKGCCNDLVYPHDEPHEHANKEGVVTHRWEEVTQIKDLPFDCYAPRNSEAAKHAQATANAGEG